MTGIKSIAVFCGSRSGKNSLYMEAATAVGNVLVNEKIDLIYGGGNNGLMGAVAKVVYEGGRNVTGIIPQLGWDVMVTHGDIINVESLEERKSVMFKAADAFIALPGGFGTMDELMEVIDMNQLGIHDKPIGILNVNNYYDKLLEWIENSIEEEFMYSRGRDIIIADSDPVNLIKRMQAKNEVVLSFPIVNGKFVV